MSDPALTPEVLEKLVRLDREATRGPWEWDRSGVWQVDSAGPVLDLPYEGAPADGVGVVGDPYPRGGNNPTESMELIATMRNALPALLATAQRVQELEAKLDQALRERYEALSVTSKEGMLASEWVARTGKAERENDRLRARVAELEGDKALLDLIESWVTSGSFRDFVDKHRGLWTGTFREWLIAARQAEKETTT